MWQKNGWVCGRLSSSGRAGHGHWLIRVRFGECDSAEGVARKGAETFSCGTVPHIRVCSSVRGVFSSVHSCLRQESACQATLGRFLRFFVIVPSAYKHIKNCLCALFAVFSSQPADLPAPGKMPSPFVASPQKNPSLRFCGSLLRCLCPLYPSLFFF